MNSARIPKLEDGPLLNRNPIAFSFKYLHSSGKFCVEECSREFLVGLLQEIKRLSTLSVADFCDYDNERHSHHIDFQRTSEPNGFTDLGEQIEPDAFWQFAVKPKSLWRVHGFFIESTFYVVWLDEHHLLDT